MVNDQNKPENSQPDSKKVAQKQKMAKVMVFELASEFAFLIAVPVIAFVYAGKWLDNRYHTKVYVILGFFLALTISCVSIGKRINQIRKRLK